MHLMHRLFAKIVAYRDGRLVVLDELKGKGFISRTNSNVQQRVAIRVLAVDIDRSYILS
jgi:hypothetical protein